LAQRAVETGSVSQTFAPGSIAFDAVLGGGLASAGKLVAGIPAVKAGIAAARQGLGRAGAGLKAGWGRRGGAGRSGAGGDAALGDKVFRVWGGEAGPNGRSWTRTDPLTVPGFRDAAGLPNQNSGRFVSEGRLTSTEGVKTRGALELHGNKGGLDEVVVPHPESQIQLERVSGANPEF
jgi:hypothetical protein